mgnify:CR=1 FL=1
MDSTLGLYWDGNSFVSNNYRMQEDYETAINGTSNLLYDRLKKLDHDIDIDKKIRSILLKGTKEIQHRLEYED